MPLDVRRLRVLRELAARGTVAATADAMGYTASAVSQQLSALEREAGVDLLEREGRRLRLTDAGRLLVGHAEALLARLEEAEADLEASTRTVAGSLRIAAFSSAARTVVPAAIELLLAEHPDVEVEVLDEDPGEALPLLRLGDRDVVLGHDFPFEAPLADPAFHRVDLMDDELALALGPSRHDLVPDFRELEGQPWIAGHLGTSCNTVVVRACRAAGHEPVVIGRSNDYGVILQLVGRDLGISIAPRITHDLAPPGVRLVPLRPALSRRILAVTRAGAQRRPSVSAMLAALRSAALQWSSSQ